MTGNEEPRKRKCPVCGKPIGPYGHACDGPEASLTD